MANNNDSRTSFVISPFALSQYLYLLGCGASGQTATSIGEILNIPINGLTSPNQLPSHLHYWQNYAYVQFCSTIYVSQNYEINDAFQNVATNQFYAPIQSISFANRTTAAAIINNRVAQQSSNNVTNIIAPQVLTPETEIVVATAINFNEEWYHRFLPENTKTLPFYTGNCGSGQSEPVQMMRTQVCGTYHTHHSHNSSAAH